MNRPPHLHYGRTPRFERLALLAAGALLAVATGLAYLQGIDLHEILRDPSSVTQGPLHAGFMSLVGVLFWTAGAAVCWFAGALLLGTPGDRGVGCMLLSVAALTTLLGLDDLFLLHETIFPWYLGMPEKVALGSYGLATVAILFFFRNQILDLGAAGLVWALALFGLSLGVDLLQHSLQPFLGQGRILLEDGAKFLGIVAWNGYFAHAGWSQIGRRLGRVALGDEVPTTELRAA